MIEVAPFLRGVMDRWRPPTDMSLSEWADRHYYLSPESAAEPGRWHTIPYQRGIMDAITDPAITYITVQKSARVGWTKIMNAAIAYYMHQDPCPIMVVQPTLADAQGYSKEEIAPMLRDVPVLKDIVQVQKTRRTGQTILMKHFPGGLLDIIGSNSGAGFRRKSRRVLIFDEVDGLAVSAGGEGDPLKLGIRRTEHYSNRKILAGSTPLVAGVSRIAEMYEEGDGRKYFVPCPHCGHMDVFVFRRQETGGHFMTWADGKPETARFVCSENGCVIEHKDKRAMVAAGEWRASRPFAGHASFHIWAAYSMSPNATWAQLAKEFIDSNKGGPEKLKTFVNTVLGETWNDKGEAPDWELLFMTRREPYPIGSVNEKVGFLTCGVDVQKDRFVYEVVGWDYTKESWSVDIGVLMGDTAEEATWKLLDELLSRNYETAAGASFTIAMMAVDSGWNTQMVYHWCRRYPQTRVIAIKGSATARTFLGTPTAVDLKRSGKRVQRGFRVWPVGVSIGKSELYGWLKMKAAEDGTRPTAGWCHFPEYDAEYFKQLTGEHLITTKRRNGRTSAAWAIMPGRENHYLDARIYARYAASVKGLDRHRAAPVDNKSPTPGPAANAPTRPAPPRQAPRGQPGGWLKHRGSGWLKR